MAHEPAASAVGSTTQASVCAPASTGMSAPAATLVPSSMSATGVAASGEVSAERRREVEPKGRSSVAASAIVSGPSHAASAAISEAASARAKTVGRISTPVKIALGSSGAVAAAPETPAVVSTTAEPSR